MTKNRDMTVGSPMKILVTFMVPILLGNIIQQLYSLADTWVVGNFVNPMAVGAIGSTQSLTFLFFSVAIGLSVGGSILVGQHFGAGNEKKCRKAVTTMVLYTVMISTVVTIVAVAFSRQLLEAMNTKAELFEDALSYFSIYMGGTVFIFTYNGLGAIFRALGDSKTPLMALIIASLTNVVLDLVFVLVFGWGVAGTAIATVLSQALSCVICAIILWKRIKTLEAPDERGFAHFFDTSMVGKITKLAIPNVLQMCAVSLVNVFLQMITNSFPAVYVSANSVAARIDNLAFMPTMSISASVSAFTAQNVGAGKLDRIKTMFRSATILMLCVCAVMSTTVFIFGPQIMHLFVSGDNIGQIIEIGTQVIRFTVVFAIVMGMMKVTENILTGAGDVNIVMMITIIGMIAKLAFAFFMKDIIGFKAVYYCTPIGSATEFILAYIRYKSGAWKKKAVAKRNPIPEAELVELSEELTEIENVH